MGVIGSGNKRPAKAMDWGVGSPTFEDDFQEPDISKKQSGWFLGERVPYQFLNWLFNNTTTWLKNLDARAPRQAYINWVVDPAADAGDRDYTSLSELVTAINSFAVYKHRVLIRGTHTLTAALTISGEFVHLIFDQDAAVHKGVSGNHNALIIAGSEIEIEGGYWYGWHNDASTPIKVNNFCKNIKISNMSFSSGTTNFVDDSAVTNGDVPSITRMYRDY